MLLLVVARWLGRRRAREGVLQPQHPRTASGRHAIRLPPGRASPLLSSVVPSNSPRAPPSARVRGAWVCKPVRDSGLPFVSGAPGAARVVVANCRADAGVDGRREALAAPLGGSCSTLKQLAGPQKQLAEAPRVFAMPGTPRGGERRTQPCFYQIVNASLDTSFVPHGCSYLVPRFRTCSVL